MRLYLAVLVDAVTDSPAVCVSMALRRNGMAITHNNATCIPPALMPGYGGHVPSIKFGYGETFGNASSRYFQEYRSRSIPAGKNPPGNTLLPSVGTDAVRTPRDQAHSRALSAAYWSRCNVDVERQMALKTFGQLCQEHRARYNGQAAGSSERVGHFILPVKESDRVAQDHKSLPAPALSVSYTGNPQRGEVRHFRTFPSGIRVGPDERVMRDVFFQRR